MTTIELPTERPTLASGFATHKGESRYPELWNGLVFWADATLGKHSPRDIVGQQISPNYSLNSIQTDGWEIVQANTDYIDFAKATWGPWIDYQYSFFFEITIGEFSPAGWLLDDFDGNNSRQYITLQDNGRLQWYTFDGNDTSQTGFGFLPKNLRWPVCFVFDRAKGSKRVYQNGLLTVDNTFTPSTLRSGSGTFRLGARLNNSNTTSVTIHRFGAWGRALTSHEIQQLSVVYQPLDS